MKKLIVTATWLLFAYLSFSQDIIFKKQGGRIEVQNIEIVGKFVHYTAFGIRNSSPEKIHLGYISMIDYVDKGIEFFNEPIPDINAPEDENKIIEPSFAETQTNVQTDVIYKVNGGIIRSDVLEIKQEEITYRNSDNNTVESIPTYNLQKIIYKDGTQEDFNNTVVVEPQPSYDMPAHANVESVEYIDIDDVEEAGKKVKTKVLIDSEYDRSSMTFLALNTNNSQVGEINRNLRVPEKYFDNDVGNKLIEVDNHSDDLIQEIENSLHKSDLSKKIVSHWFNRNTDGSFDMKRIMGRGEYNATDAEYYMATASKRGFDALKDQGVTLIDKSYVVVFKVDDPMTMNQYYINNGVQRKDRTKNGFIGNVSAYVYKIDFNENVAQTFFQNCWINEDEPNVKVKKERYENFNCPLKFINSYSTTAEGSQYNPKHALGSKEQLSESELLALYADYAVENILTRIEGENDALKTKAPIVSTNPIKVPIGKKESVKFDQRYFVYENRQDKNGQLYSKRVGVIRAKNVSDNKYVTSGNSSHTVFYQTAGKQLDEYGMFIQQNNDRGFSLSAGYIYKPIDYADTDGFLFRVGYYPRHFWTNVLGKKDNWFSSGLFTSMYIYSDITFYLENSERTSYSGGIGNDLHFARNFKLSPYFGYGSDKYINDYDNVSNIGFIEGGMLLGVNLTHNTSFNLHGKAAYYYDVSIINLLANTEFEELSIGLNASIQVLF